MFKVKNNRYGERIYKVAKESNAKTPGKDFYEEIKDATSQDAAATELLPRLRF